MAQRANEMTPAALRATTRTQQPAAVDTEPERVEIEIARAQIEQTRSEMSETIDAIQDRLDPQRLAEQAKDAVHEATIGKVEGAVSAAADKVQDLASTAGEKAGDTLGAVTQRVQDAIGTGDGPGMVSTATHGGRSLVDMIRQNPLPAALIGIGLGWLYLRTRRNDGMAVTSYPPPVSAPQQQYTSGTSPKAVVGKVQDTAGHLAGRATDSVSQAASRTSEGVSRVAGSAGEGVSRVAGSAGESLSQLGSRATYTAQRTSDSLGDLVQRNPLAVGAATAALGMVAGLIVPQTEQENRLLGQAHDAALERAGQAAQDATQRVQNIAQQAVSAAKEAAQQGAPASP